MAIHVLASLSFRTRLSGTTLEALLDQNCVHKYVLKFSGLSEGGSKTVHIEFFDDVDRRRVQTALRKLAADAPASPKPRQLPMGR